MPEGGFIPVPGALEEIRLGIAILLTAAGEYGEFYAQSVVPIDTGQLHDSIGFTVNVDELTLTLYAEMDYAEFVEFGTSKMSAQPYLRPAAAAVARHFFGINADLGFSNAGGHAMENIDMTEAFGDELGDLLE